MANTIKHKRGSGSNPSASDLVAGEIAIRTDTGVLFTKKDDNSVVSISGGSTNLGVSTTSSAVTVTSSTGDNATISEASGTAAGVMSTAHHDKLDGIESGATADQSASEILTAIKTVDGASSGLDADLLDGQQGSYYLNTSSTAQTKSGDIRLGGSTYNIAIGRNNVGASNSVGHTATYNEGIFWHTSNTSYAIYRTSGAWSNPYQQLELNWPTGIRLDGGTAYGESGVRVIGNNNSLTVNGNVAWNAGNDGSGSGLDADLLDGVHGSSFLRSDAADTMSGNLTVNARLDVGNGSGSDTEIRVYKADNNVSDHIQFYNGTTRVGEIGCEDSSWLRINQETAKNIYTPRYMRADGGFFVDGTSKGINGSGNFIGGTIAGASDYGTLIRSNADDNVTGHTEWQDTKQVRLGNSADMKLHHTSGVNYIDVAQDLLIRHGTETMIRCNDDSDVELYHNNSKKLETTSSGISVTGNVAVSGGIDFSADGNAAGATTEVLDDYEKGTWTPVYRGSSTAGSYSPGSATGVYAKVGNVVYASASILNIGGSGGSGNLQISGFPFANNAGQSSLGHVFLDDFNMTNTAVYLVAIMSANDTNVTIREVKDTAADTTMSVTDLDGSNSDILVTITYIAA